MDRAPRCTVLRSSRLRTVVDPSPPAKQSTQFHLSSYAAACCLQATMHHNGVKSLAVQAAKLAVAASPFLPSRVQKNIIFTVVGSLLQGRGSQWVVASRQSPAGELGSLYHGFVA